MPFLTNPTSCNGLLTTKLTVTSHQAPDEKVVVNDTTPTPPDAAATCVPFAPSIAGHPDDHEARCADRARASTCTSRRTRTRRRSPARTCARRVVTLPPGLTLNPSAANGLEACSDEQFGKGTNSAVTCPAASRIGTRLDHLAHAAAAPITGGIFIGRQLADNPYRIFVVVAGFGVSVKLEGR